MVGPPLDVFAQFEAEAVEIQRGIAALRRNVVEHQEKAGGEPEHIRARTAALNVAWRALQDFRIANADAAPPSPPID